MGWLKRIWASMNWSPTWPTVVAPPLPPFRYQALLDCLSIVDHDDR